MLAGGNLVCCVLVWTGFHRVAALERLPRLTIRGHPIWWIWGVEGPALCVETLMSLFPWGSLPKELRWVHAERQ